MWAELGGGEGARGRGGVIQVQPLALRYSAAFRRPEHLECTQCEHLVHRKLVPWLVTFLKQTEQGYLDSPGAHHRLGLTAVVVVTGSGGQRLS